MPESGELTVVCMKLPADLVRWMDLYLLENRMNKIKKGVVSGHSTRSSFMRDLLLKAKNNGSSK